jgi:hypothetical protein
MYQPKMLYKLLVTNCSVVGAIVMMSFVGCTSKMEHVKCPAFNFDSLGVDVYYFNKSLLYSNGHDTIQLDFVDWASSDTKEIYRGNGIVVQCIPSFSVKYSDRLKENEIYFSFTTPIEVSNFSYLDVQVNLRSAEICLDTIEKFGSTRVPVIDPLEFHGQLPAELSMVTSFELDNYRVVCFEKSNGEIWDLIKMQ